MLANLINAVRQAYWPFQGDAVGSRGHRMAPHFSEGLRSDDTPTTRTLRERKTIRDFSDDIDSDFGILRGNTGIPDEKFGPDEERIIIDDDPYDLDEAIFALQNRDEDPRSTPKMISHRRKPSPTKSAIDFIEESIRNAKRHEAQTAKDKRFGKKPTKKTDLVEELISAVKHEREKNFTSDAESKAREFDDNFEKELPEIEIREIDDVSSDSDDLEKSLINESQKQINDEALNDGQTNAVVTSEPESITGTQMESEDVQNLGTTDPEEMDGIQDSGLTEESTDTPVSPETDVTGDLTSSTLQGTLNTWEILTSTAFESGNGEAQSTLQPVVILGRSKDRLHMNTYMNSEDTIESNRQYQSIFFLSRHGRRPRIRLGHHRLVRVFADLRRRWFSGNYKIMKCKI